MTTVKKLPPKFVNVSIKPMNFLKIMDALDQRGDPYHLEALSQSGNPLSDRDLLLTDGSFNNMQIHLHADGTWTTTCNVDLRGDGEE